jgi:hypothetical protein
MTEAGPAKALELGHTYIVSLSGDTSGSMYGPRCYGSLRFKISSDGAITDCHEEGAACG